MDNAGGILIEFKSIPTITSTTGQKTKEHQINKKVTSNLCQSYETMLQEKHANMIGAPAK